MKQKFNIIGMSCGACAARVEEAVGKLDGVTRASVNLLQNTLLAEFDENRVKPEDLIIAVEKTGFRAQAATDENVLAPREQLPAAQESKNLKRRFWISLVCMIPLFYISMGVMFGLPLPAFLLGEHRAGLVTLFQLLLTTPILYVNRSYFTKGFKALFTGSPNMESLIAVGSSAAVLYGIYTLIRIVQYLQVNDFEAVLRHKHDLYFESAGMILTLITLGKYLESRAKGKASDAVGKLLDLAPKTALLLRDGNEEEVPVDQLKVGDLVVVKQGSTIPADGEVVDGRAAVDESALTGESIPADKTLGDKVVGATISRAGYFTFRVEKVGSDTMLAQIIRLVEEANSTKAPIARLADKISSIFVPSVIILAVFTTIAWILAGHPFDFALSIGIAVLVISCPCALGLATPAAIMVGTGKGAENGILIKSAESLEVARSVTSVVLDKTGTLTEGKPRVTDILPANGVERELLLKIAGSAERASEHPLSDPIVEEAIKEGLHLLPNSDFVSYAGEGISVKVNMERVWAGNAQLMAKYRIDVGDNEYIAQALAREGKTPIFFAARGKLMGIIALADTLKPTSRQAICVMEAMGLEVAMITGDNKRTATAIGRQLGIETVISEVLPQDKEQKIQRLQLDGKIVAMVGDGINDAPALARADVGIALGAGTDIAVESAGIVLVKNDLLSVVSALQLSRAVVRNIKQNLFWAFFYNIICIPLAAGAFYPAFGWKLNPIFAAAAMSLSSVCVVSNALRLRFFKPDFSLIRIRRKRIRSNQKRLLIRGMDGPRSRGLIEEALNAMEGVEAEVSFRNKMAVVTLKQPIGDEALVNVIKELGYRARVIK